MFRKVFYRDGYREIEVGSGTWYIITRYEMMNLKRDREVGDVSVKGDGFYDKETKKWSNQSYQK